MSTTSQTNADTSNLSEKRYVTVVVRMVIDRREQLVHGEIVDMNGVGQGRFEGWRELISTIRDYLTKQPV